MLNMDFFFLIKLCCLFSVVIINNTVETRNLQETLPKCPEIGQNDIKLQQELLQLLPLELETKPTVQTKFLYGHSQIPQVKYNI